MKNIDLFKDYENSRLVTAEEYSERCKDRTVPFKSIGDREIEGIPICVRRDCSGELQVTFIEDTHLLAIGATRSGKTTGYVIPTLNVLLNKKNKPSLVISDPKQELYRSSAGKFIDNGYKVLMLDFTNYTHSDGWNPLTKYYRLYQNYLNVENNVQIVKTKNGLRNKFCDRIYEDQAELDSAVKEVRESYLDEVEKGISAFCAMVISCTNTKEIGRAHV